MIRRRDLERQAARSSRIGNYLGERMAQERIRAAIAAIAGGRATSLDETILELLLELEGLPYATGRKTLLELYQAGRSILDVRYV